MKLLTFWRTLVKSITSARYYREVVKAPFWFSFRFFIMSMVLLSPVVSYRLQQRVFPQYKQLAQQGIAEAAQQFPEDLQINWEDEQLTTSPSASTTISWPQGFNYEEQNLPGSVAYVDTTGETTSTENLNSLFLVTNTRLFMNDLQGNWTDFPLSSMFNTDSFSFNKDNLPELVEVSNLALDGFYRLAIIATYIIAPFVLIGSRLWIGLLESFLAYLVLKMNRSSMSFPKVYQLGLHIMVVVEIIVQVADWIYPNHQLPLFTIGYWLMFVYILWINHRVWVRPAKST